MIAANTITAKQVGINSSKTSKTNMQDAIDELYTLTTSYKKSNIEMAKIGDTYKAIVYLDPTNLSRSCNKSNSVSTVGTKTGCMKWYVFRENSNNYVMILDHKTTKNVAWNSESGSTPKEVQTELNKLVSVSGWKVTPRMITANEVASIIGATNWKQSENIYHTYTYNSYKWLTSIANFWTSTSIGTSGAWFVSIYSDLNFMENNGVSSIFNNVGLAPVIEIAKSSI